MYTTFRSTNFCIHFVYKLKRTMTTNCVYQMYAKGVHHKNYIYNLYTKSI